jgi:hypothetical protein
MQGGVEVVQKVGERSDGINCRTQSFGEDCGRLRVDVAEIHEARDSGGPSAMSPSQAVDQDVVSRRKLFLDEGEQWSEIFQGAFNGGV